jgi:Mn-dependent DtxR family transcriptional regulator
MSYQPERDLARTDHKAPRETPRLEDYLEAIYNLVRNKGYAGTIDIADNLNVRPPTVSGMLRRLDSRGYLVHEPYRGMKLTAKGEKVARSVIERHETIWELLALLGVEENVAFEDTEGIEHHIHPATIHTIERLVDFLHKNPDQLRAIRDHIKR